MPEPGASLILLDTDLFFVVKVRTTLQHAGYDVATARTLEDFTRKLAADSPTLALVNTAIVDIDWRAAIMAARAARIPVVAFGSHVDLETQQAARQAGATRVIANSKLATDLPGIVARTLQSPSHVSASLEDSADSAGNDAPQREASPPEATKS
jgi:DNA-binding NtrC family response regulator